MNDVIIYDFCLTKMEFHTERVGGGFSDIGKKKLCLFKTQFPQIGVERIFWPLVGYYHSSKYPNTTPKTLRISPEGAYMPYVCITRMYVCIHVCMCLSGEIFLRSASLAEFWGNHWRIYVFGIRLSGGFFFDAASSVSFLRAVLTKLPWCRMQAVGRALGQDLLWSNPHKKK